MYSIVPLLALLPATYGAAVSLLPLIALSIPNPPYVQYLTKLKHLNIKLLS
jgi:hypothetical protein